MRAGGLFQDSLIGSLVLVKKKLDDGQLDECPLTLNELREIKGTVNGNTGMLPILRGIFHIRIEYPEEKTKQSGPTKQKVNIILFITASADRFTSHEHVIYINILIPTRSSPEVWRRYRMSPG